MSMTTLSDLNMGDKGQIVCLQAAGEIRRRLMDMGLVKGTCFKVVRRAPLGDPIEIFVKGFNLSLRKEEAQKLQVKKIGNMGDGISMRSRQEQDNGQENP